MSEKKDLRENPELISLHRSIETRLLFTQNVFDGPNFYLGVFACMGQEEEAAGLLCRR